MASSGGASGPPRVQQAAVLPAAGTLNGSTLQMQVEIGRVVGGQKMTGSRYTLEGAAVRGGN